MTATTLSPALSVDGVTVYQADCLEALRAFPDASIDSIVTDPPYGIEFMGKEWDSFKNKDRNTGAKNPGQTRTWCDDASSGIGVGGPRFSTQTAQDARNFQEWFERVAAECLRVLKPGGHMLSFGGTRMYHRMVCAMEDAGFEIRDSIHWTYGSGFPKSLDVSKAIDKRAGAKRKVVGKAKRSQPAKSGHHGGLTGDNIKGVDEGRFTPDITAPATDDARTWQGWGTALKPSHEPIVVARKPLAGTVAQNVLAHGTGALNIDGTRVGRAAGDVSTGGYGNGGVGMSEIGAAEQKAGKGAEWVTSTEGRWPANTVLTHAAGCRQTGEAGDTFGGGARASSGFVDGYEHDGFVGQSVSVPLFACVPGCPVAALDEQSGSVGAAAPASGPTYSGPSKSGSMAGAFKGNGDKPATFHADKGGASRFFTCTEWDPEWGAPFLYVAKPSKRERNAGLTGLPEQAKSIYSGGITSADHPETASGGGNRPSQNFHPTVKPVALMRHLVRLVTPPGGVVLDPFLGSGTTAVGAILEGFRVVGCEMTAECLPIIKGRVEHALTQRPDPDLFTDARPLPAE